MSSECLLVLFNSDSADLCAAGEDGSSESQPRLRLATAAWEVTASMLANKPQLDDQNYSFITTGRMLCCVVDSFHGMDQVGTAHCPLKLGAGRPEPQAAIT